MPVRQPHVLEQFSRLGVGEQIGDDLCLEVWVTEARDVLSGGAQQSLHETRGVSHLSGGRSHFMPPVPVGGIPRPPL